MTIPHTLKNGGRLRVGRGRTATSPKVTRVTLGAPRRRSAGQPWGLVQETT